MQAAGLGLTGTLALAGSQRPASSDENKKVYGSAFLNSHFAKGEEIRDAVKLRYKCQVVENQCFRPEMWKIIFMFHFFHTPQNAKTYELQTNLYTWRFVYPHLSRRSPGEDVKGLRNLAGETSLFCSVPDNYQDKRMGAQSRAPAMFPTLDQEIDGIKGLWKREQVSQTNVSGKTLSIEIARGDITKEPKGWSVHGELPPGQYRIWMTTAILDGTAYRVDFVMPEESARFFVPWRMTQIATEAFFDHPGLFKAFFWDIEQFKGRIDSNGKRFESGIWSNQMRNRKRTPGG